MNLPYTQEIHQNEDGSFFIKIKELPGCMTEADTLAEASLLIQDAMHAWLEAALEDLQAIPVPTRKKPITCLQEAVPVRL
jgi:antitoxin HicB